ncbi:MAG: helix-turn-helix domain-containing protein [Actinobacteria bacterium]|nr:helix-turn-helix domain-containing protein [Actinomycetota bacterium]
MRRSDFDRAVVRELLAAGHNDREVAELSGVSQNTVGRWRRSWPAIPICWRPAHGRSYAYLLGLYLGDGWVWVHRRGGVVLRVSLDTRYRDVIDDCWAAMVLSMPQCRPRLVRHQTAQAVQVQSCNKLWLQAFPQHGPGRKHERTIVLEDWQQEIVDLHPDEFVRGLIHSDGCRTTNRFRTRLPSGRVAEYAYARYFFSNLSEDIRGLFCAACDALDVRWTLSNPRNVSVAHRASVTRLDAIGCAKA